MSANRLTKLFNVKYPIVQGGMIWCSGWELASAVSNAGGLGLIGAGSMPAATFAQHLKKCQAATDKPFGVNIPLMHKEAQPIMESIIAAKVPVVFTSAGSPKTWTKRLKDAGIVVVHVVPNTKLALKCQEAGVDAVVAEGFEAGGHNGVEEITTMTLIPQVRRHLRSDIPLIAAGGIASGQAMLASMALGADGVQVGTRFALTKESSCSQAFKEACVASKEGETWLTMKRLMPTRLLLNKQGKAIRDGEANGATKEEMSVLKGRGKTRLGMFEGDVVEGELEIGQIASDCNDIPTVEEVVKRMIKEFNETQACLNGVKF